MYTFVTTSTSLCHPRVLSRFLHSVPPYPLSLQARVSDKMREEEKVRKRWRIALNSGSRSANVPKRYCTNTHASIDRCGHVERGVTLKPEATRRLSHTDVIINLC